MEEEVAAKHARCETVACSLYMFNKVMWQISFSY